MSKKLKSKVAAFLLVLQFLFSFVLPLQPLVSLVQAQENQAVTFSKNESSISVANSQASKFSYFFKDGNTTHGSKESVTDGGNFKLDLKSQSGEDETPFDVKRLVLKTDLNSYFLEITENEVSVLKEYQVDSLELNAEEENFLVNAWQTDSAIRMSTTSADVVLNQEYRFPLNEEVQVIFTKLPRESSPLSIQEIQLSAAQQKALGTTASVAYDVTTSMKDGEFAFDLRLPSVSSENKDVSVKFAETVAELTSAEIAENELTVNDEGDVTVKNLDHMTIFVVVDDGDANYGDNSWNNYTSSGYSGDVHWVNPSQTGKVATWTFNGAAGKYAILPSWIIWTDHATNAHYTSSNIAGFDLSGVNQKIVANTSVVGTANGLWSGWYVNSGRYDLVSGNTITLSVEPSITNGNLTADAIAFVGMSDIYVDDNWIGNATGQDLGSGKIFGVNAFATVQEGITAVSDGGTVNVANGTYVEVGQIVINKAISIIGEDKVNTIIKPAQNTGSSGDSRGWIFVDSGANFTLQNITLDGDGKLVSIGVLSRGSGTIDNNIIKNMAFNPSGSGYDGRGIAFYDSNATIKNNLVQNFGRIGIYTYGGTALIENNIIEGKGAGDQLDYGVEVEGGSSSVIKGNTISGAKGVASVDGSTSAAIMATTYFAPGTNLKIINNSIHDNAYGIALGYNNDTTSVTQFDGNTFSNNNYDLDNYTVNNVDARNNIWSVIDQNDLNQIDAKINHRCSGSNYIHGICSGTNDYGSGFGSVSYKSIETPTNLGWNVSSKSITPNETPLDFSCSISSSYTNENSVAQNWSSISGVGIKYQRQVTYPSSTVGYFNAGSLTYTPFSVFGSSSGIEGLWKTKVRSYVDANNNNIPDAGEETSAWSNECNITLDKTAPTTSPTLVSPANNAYVGGNPTQTWTSVSGAHHYLYQSASNNSFSPLIYSTSVSGTSRTVSGNQTISFWWRVRAVDAAGNEGPWSTAWFLNVDNTAPVKPILVSPANNDHVKGAVLTNDWQDVDGAVKYIYESYHNSAATLLRFRGEYTDSQKTATNVADTEFWWRVKAVDAAGNEGPWSDLWHVVVDSTSPFLVSKSTFTGWLNANQLSTFTFDDARSEIISGLPVSCTISTEGTAQICSVTPNVCDEAGNCYTSVLTSNGADIDKTKPTSTISTPTDSSLITNDWDGVISGAAADAASGVDRVELEINHSVSGLTLVTATGSLDGFGQYNWSYTLPNGPEEGTYTITSHAIDKVGNRENSYTITIIYDKTIPTVGITVNPDPADGKNGWYKTQPTVTLTATDLIELDKIEYQWDSKDGAWTTYVNPIQLSSEGRHILYYRAIDKAGNGYEEKNTGVRNLAWDKTELTEGPLKVDATPDRSGGPDAKVTWEAATDNVGIDHYKVTFDLLNGDADFSEDVASHVRELKTNRLKESGTWKITVIAYDGAGHEKSASDEIVIDKTAPAAPTLNLTGTGAGSVNLAWNKVDEADEYIILYGVNDGEYTYAARVGNVLSYTVQGLTAGNYYFVVRAEDGSGNQSANSNQVSTLSLLAAPGGGNEVAQGFEQAPEVLGVNTAEQPKSEAQAASNGEVQGANTSCNDLVNSLWWILLLAQFIGLFITEYKLGKKQKWLKLGLYALLAVAPFTLTHYFVSQACFSNAFTSWMVRYYFVPVLTTAMLAKVASYLLIEDES